MADFIFFGEPWVLPAVMLVVLALSIELPYRFARTVMARDAIDSDALNVVQAGLITLATFVLGLSFAQASGRFDARRALVVKEANAIGTTWLRAGQLAPADAAQFRRQLADYTAVRIKAYETPGAPALYRLAMEESLRDQDALWSMASSALQARQTNLGLSLLMQTLNDTIDVSAEQVQALRSHVPTAMVVFTLLLVTLATFSTGIRFARDQSRPLVLSAIFVAACVIVITMNVDYDRPQTGLVTVDLTPLRLQLQSMQPQH